MKNTSNYLLCAALSTLLLASYSCQTEPVPATCQEKIQGEWVCTSIDDAPPELDITLSFEADGDGEFRVTENTGQLHLYFVEQWVITDCNRLEFTYFINGYENYNDLIINEIEEDVLGITGKLLGLYYTDTRFVFKRR